MTPSQVDSELSRKIQQLGFSDHRWVHLAPPDSIHLYEEWLNRNYEGDMHYLKSHLDKKREPRHLFPEAQSVMILTFPYWNHPFPFETHLKIASYAKGMDYHFWIKEKLEEIIQFLKTRDPKLKALPLVDSQAFLERNYGAQSGLGWIGKNNCLISRQQGSLFFLCEILFNTPAIASGSVSDPASGSVSLSPDHCGTCQKCIEACPTEAIDQDRTLIANRCISYLTIEAKSSPSLELRSKIKDHFFGCDICQTVCPWNSKPIKINPSSVSADPAKSIEELRFVLEASGKQVLKKYAGTPLTRAGHFGLRRNALVVIGNMKYRELEPSVRKWKSDSRLGELADWCLAELGV